MNKHMWMNKKGMLTEDTPTPRQSAVSLVVPPHTPGISCFLRSS